MKKKQMKVQEGISKTSFQAQLFLIILIVFALFVIGQYLIIQYSFKGQYINSEVITDSNSVNDYITKINEENEKDTSEKNTVKIVEEFTSDTGSISVFLDASGGGYVLSDSNGASYLVSVRYQGNDYDIKLSSYQIEAEVGDNVNAYIKLSLDGETYTASSLEVAGKNYRNGVNNSGGKAINNGTIIAISRPDNLNYYYENYQAVETGIDVITENLAEFKEVSATSSSLYYLDSTNNVLYFLSPLDNVDSSYVLTIFSVVETASLLSIISSYYGYIVLISIVIAILIALFISRAFSIPVKTIEQEMRKLADDDYTTTDFKFKNKELISLQETLNYIKKETEEKVKNISSQKEVLEKLNQELLKEEELRSSFVQRLSHELKTPLMVISATTEAIMDNVIPEDEIESEYNTILEEVDKTTKIIKDIINTYKSSSKGIKLNISRFNLNNLVKEIADPLYPVAQKRNLTIQENLNEVVYMNADRDLIGQVISNFLTNAIKYTKEKELIEINIIDNKTAFVFEVKNHGAHIKEENLQKIWLPFYRENENVDKDSTGIGLYIVKEILNAHSIGHDIVNTEDAVRAYFVIQK